MSNFSIRKQGVSSALVVVFGCLTSNAFAHIELLEPASRYTNARSGDNKACPCGDGTSNRTCAVATERSDDNRSTQTTTLTAGEMLTVRFDEYVAHSGRFRVAFDDNGADLPDFNAHPLEDIPDPPGRVGNTGDGSIWEIDVEVPNTPCDNCTLQLIQMMDGNMSEPVADPVGRSSYYACADIVIVATGEGNNAGSSGAGGDTGAIAGAAGQNDDGAPVTSDPDAEDDGGCSLGRPANARGFSILFAVALGLTAALRRRARVHGC